MDDIAFFLQADTQVLAISSREDEIVDFNRQLTQAQEVVENLSIDQGLGAVQIERSVRYVRDSIAFFVGVEGRYQQKLQWIRTKTALAIRDWVRAEATLAIREETAVVTATYIQANPTPATHSEANNTPETGSQASIITSGVFNAQFMRQWFAKSIVHPYFRIKMMQAGVAIANAFPSGELGGREQRPINYKRLQLWTNILRQQSGWTSFKNIYARNDRVSLEALISVLRRQGQAPPAGEMDDIAMLMSAWDVPMMVEGEGADDIDDYDDDEEQQQQVRANIEKRSRGEETLVSRSSQSTANPRSSVNPAAADPIGTIRSKACRNAYSKMMDSISAGSKTRANDWLDEIFETVFEGEEEKSKIVAQKGPVASSNVKLERKIAVLPSRASELQDPLFDHSANSTPSQSNASSSSASIDELPSSGSIVLSPRKAARLPGSELGPRLPSTVASESTLVPTNFWQASLASNPSLSSFITPSANTSLPTASMNFTLSMPLHGFDNGVPAQLRNSSIDSSFSGITDITQSSQSTDSSATTQSSQASYAYFASGMGMGDSSLVRSNCPSEASPSVGQSWSPAAARHGEVRARDDNSVESAPKRFRAGNRPRHTDGGAPMNMTNLSMMPVDQAPCTARTMNPQPGMGGPSTQ
ncbi:unnamed protein product [Tilletia controversa]|nr:unnamed protein product [Tilletia controversa]